VKIHDILVVEIDISAKYSIVKLKLKLHKSIRIKVSMIVTESGDGLPVSLI
jgi:hypothetical protein